MLLAFRAELSYSLVKQAKQRNSGYNIHDCLLFSVLTKLMQKQATRRSSVPCCVVGAVVDAVVDVVDIEQKSYGVRDSNRRPLNASSVTSITQRVCDTPLHHMRPDADAKPSWS